MIRCPINNIDNGRIPSLRWRLLRLTSLATLLIVGLAAVLTYRQARLEVRELMDGQLTKFARILAAQAQMGTDHLAELPVLMANQRGLRARRNELTLEYQIGRADGTLLAHSVKAPANGLGNSLGFSNIEVDGHPWRSLIIETTDGTYRVQVAQSIVQRNKEALEISVKTVLPLLVLFPLLLLAIYFSIRSGLKPLNELATDVSTRSSENLTPINNGATPREVQPLLSAINRLLFRLNGSLENERRFTADAAHELRTPLAAARIQAQVALLSEEAGKRQHALTQTLAGLDRSTRLVEQLLRLARLDPLSRLPDAKRVDLVEVAQRVVAGALDSAPDYHIDTELDEALPSIDGDTNLIEIALRNLLDNALRYSPPGSRIGVFFRKQGNDTLLGVQDNGPGVNPEELPRLIERFYRGAEASAEGSGLGLTIVRRIAELHSATLELANRDSGGFEARLRW